jgi:molybdopterin synthase catalytic subunit
MLFRITDEPIAPGALYDEVRADGDGAVVTFAGVVRDHSNGRRTDHLVYEAYPPMAEREMAKIGEEAASRWEVDDIAILHRVGRLEVGEISVLVAVSSPHRADGFFACRFAIDRLKQTVPVWKKEMSEDGEYWVEGPGMPESNPEAAGCSTSAG